MRIFSKFRDYYDSALGYGIDPKCIYIRNTIEKENSSKLFYDVFNDNPVKYSLRNYFSSTKLFLILFCGKLYPVYEIELFNSYDIFYCYSFEDVESITKKVAKKKELDNFYKEKRRVWWDRGGKTQSLAEQFVDFFDKYKGMEVDLNIHFKDKIPVYKITKELIVENPNLKEHEFYRVVDPYQAFQELSMFISGILGGNSPEMVEISDQDKIHKAGFDKWSFRKKVR